MSRCFSFYLYFPLDEFERAIRALEKVTDCGSNREGRVILPDRRELRSRLFNRDQVCFSAENKEHDFAVIPVVPILSQEEVDLSEFDEIVGPQGKWQGLIRMNASIEFGWKYLRIRFDNYRKSISSLLMNSLSTDTFFWDLYRVGRGLFILWDDDAWDGIYPLVPLKASQDLAGSEEPSYKMYAPDFAPAFERIVNERLRRGCYPDNDIDYETETLLDEIQLLDIDRIKAMGFGIPEGYFLQRNLVRNARQNPQSDQSFVNQVLLTQSCYDGNLPEVNQLLLKGVSCEIVIDKNLLHLKKWFFADAELVYGLTPLMAAAVNGRVRIMERLLAHGVDVDQPNYEGYTALELVAGHEDSNGLALLLAGGAKIPIAKNHKGALELAAENGVPENVRLILDAPGGVLTETDKLRALIYAIRNSDISDDCSMRYHQEVIELLLSLGLDLNCPVEARTSFLTVDEHEAIYEDRLETASEPWQTDTFLPLFEGVVFCRPETVEMMIRAGADVQQVFREQTPFDRAVHAGEVEMMDLLLQQGATFISCRISELLADIAPQAPERPRFRKTASRLLELGAKGTTQNAMHAALLGAVECGDPDQVHRLLEQHADPNLKVACPEPDQRHFGRNLPLLSLAIDQGHTAVAERLLEHPAIRLHDVDHRGKTALHHAMEKGAIGLIKLMVKQIQINRPYGEENHRKPALILSIENGLNEITERLLTLPGIDVNVAGPDDRTALHLASRKKDVDLVRQLLQKGARPDPKILYDPHFLSSGGEVDSILSLLLSFGLDINQRDERATTPLMKAALYVCWFRDGLELDPLLKAGADPNLTDKQGRTAATYCLIDHVLFSGEQDFDTRKPALDRLIASGADLNIGYNPLMFLANCNNPRLMEDLLSYRIDPDACLPDGNTALHLAAAKGFYEPVVLLLKAGATIDRQNKAGQTPLALALSHIPDKAATDILPIHEDLERYGMAPEKKKTIRFLTAEQRKRVRKLNNREKTWFSLIFEKLRTSVKNRF